MGLEQEALEFIHRLQRLYFEERDFDALLTFMEQRTSWIGTGREELCHNLAEAGAALARERDEYPGRFSVHTDGFDALAVSEDTCVVYGRIMAAAENPEMANLDHRFSAVCKRTPEGMKLLHLHLSTPDGDQERGRYYTSRRAAQDRETLRIRADSTARALEEREQELFSLTENIPGGLHQCKNDPDFTLISVTSGFLGLVGYTREELREEFHDRFVEIIVPEDRERVRQTCREQLANGNTVELEYRIRNKNGKKLWILDKGKMSHLPDGSESICCLLLDHTSQHRAREELRLSLERHRIIMDQATDIIFEWDIKKGALLFSANWKKKFGYEAISEDISLRIPFSENIHPDDMPAFIKIMRDTAAGIPYSETEFRIRDLMGNYAWHRIRATTQYNSASRPIKAVGVIVDIDADKKQRQRLLEEAQRDSLTGLLNKTAARRAVEAAIQDQHSGTGALFILDLDDFKGINDRYGHLTGDTVLSDTAATLKRLMRSGDVIARIGGDEFLVYMPGAQKKEAESKARAVILALHEISIFGQKGRISCSVGVAVFPQDAENFTELYRRADLALYQVKNVRKGGFQSYRPECCVQEPDDCVIRSAVCSVIDSDAGPVNEQLGQYCFRMLYRAIEPVTAVNQILEIVGRAYDVSRVYIFESSEDGRTCSNTFEWCNTGITPEMEHLQGLSYEDDLDHYLQNFKDGGVFYCGDVRDLNAKLRAVLEPQGIRSLLQCAIVDDGQFKGYVGFDECRENRRWTRAQIETLILVANVLSTFLMKLRLKERLNQAKPS